MPFKFLKKSNNLYKDLWSSISEINLKSLTNRIKNKIFPTAYSAVQSYNGVTPQNQQQWCQNHPTIMSFNHAEPEKVCNKFRKGPKPKSEAEVVAPDLFMKLACLYQQGPSARQVYFCYLKESQPNNLFVTSKNEFSNSRI